MAFFHGVKTSEVPTSLLAPVEVDSAITMAVGTAPIHLASNPAAANEPILCYKLAEYVEKFGTTDDFENYTLAEVASSQFQLFRVAPTIFVNVLNPGKHYNERSETYAASVENPLEIETPMILDTLKITSSGVETLTLTQNVEYDVTIDTQTSIASIDIMANVTLPSNSIGIEYVDSSTAVVSTDVTIAALPCNLPVGATNLKITCDKPFTNILVEGEDYSAGFKDSETVRITFLDDTNIVDETVDIYWHELDPTQVTTADIIGSVDAAGNYTGIELIERIYPKYRVVPTILIAPKYSTDAGVAAVMKSKVTKINEVFRAIAIADLPASLTYSEAPEWKNSKNLVDENLIVCYPKVSLSGVQYHLSTQLASLMATVDGDNDDVPYVSPSNKNLQCDSSVLEDGTEQNLSLPQANYLNSCGITTALNFSQGWVAWGNSTSAFPSSTDPIDRFISIRRMMNWIANTLVTTYFAKVDAPMNRRLIETVMDSVAIWFNGLAAKGCILGGRIVFDSDDNPTTNLISGIVKFKIYVTPPPPAEQISFELEFDPDYFSTLFS